MKRISLLLTLFGAIFVALAASFFWWKVNTSPVSDDKTPVRFVIPKGKSASQIAQILYQDGLIRSPLAFKFYVQLTGRADKIQAGEFQLSKNLTPAEIVEELSKGPLQLWVTVPEGLRREEIAVRFVQGLEKNQEASLAFIDEFLDLTGKEEGFLFPDTYLFPPDATAKQVVDKMGQTFDSEMIQFHAALTNPSTSGGLDNQEIITLASIVERETKDTDERAVVAGIFLNRLDVGMPLQADATVQYAVATVLCKTSNIKCSNWWPVLTGDDLEIESPYNTYKYKGLPPAPIANPGLSSIKAVIYPSTTDYLYYIHDKDGNIHYSETLAEHNENVRKYLGK